MGCFCVIIKTIKIKKKFIYILVITIIIVLIFSYIFYNSKSTNISSNFSWIKENIDDKENSINNINKKDYIKWVDFKVTCEALEDTAKLDIESHNKNEKIKYNWIEKLSYLACKNGGDFKKYKKSDLEKLKKQLDEGVQINEITKNMKYFSYYYESLYAILSNYIGEYEIEKKDKEGNVKYEEKYGIKAFLPIAKNYSFSHYDDFGASRSYGFKRRHLGNDLLGNIGTPIIAVESGTIQHLGWNKYGGWRIGIRSLDNKRYYYYAHLRKNHPFAKDLYIGKKVTAGDVIGYLGMTGYSTKENVNNINIPHLHFGIQLIFDESQFDSSHEIWINVYEIIEFLKKNRSEVFMNDYKTKEYVRKYNIKEKI